MNIFKINHWSIKRFFLKAKKRYLPTIRQEFLNHIINEAQLNPVKRGTPEYRDLITRISIKLKEGKKIVTVIDGEILELSELNGKLTSSKIR